MLESNFTEQVVEASAIAQDPVACVTAIANETFEQLCLAWIHVQHQSTPNNGCMDPYQSLGILATLLQESFWSAHEALHRDKKYDDA